MKKGFTKISLLVATLTVVLGGAFFAGDIYASVAGRTASQISKWCANNPQYCEKDTTPNKNGYFRLLCDGTDQQVYRVFVHAGDGQTVYRLPHVGFSSSPIEDNGREGVKVKKDGHKHDISWVVLECKDSPKETATPTPTATPSATPRPTETPEPTEIPKPQKPQLSAGSCLVEDEDLFRIKVVNKGAEGEYRLRGTNGTILGPWDLENGETVNGDYLGDPSTDEETTWIKEFYNGEKWVGAGGTLVTSIEGHTKNEFFCPVEEEPEPTPTPTPTPQTPSNPTPSGFSCPNVAPVQLPINPHVIRNGSVATVQAHIPEGDRVHIYYRNNSSSDWQHALRDVSVNGNWFSVEIGALDPNAGYTFGVQAANGCAGGEQVGVIIDPPAYGEVFMLSHWQYLY